MGNQPGRPLPAMGLLPVVRDFRMMPVMDDRFDPAKDAANREKHGLFLSFGDIILAERRSNKGEEREYRSAC